MYYRDENGDWQEIILEPSGDTLPIGAITQFGGENAPTGWLICDGSAVSRTTYSELFEAIGTTYGTGDGSTTFNVPDFVGRVPVGLDEEDTDFETLGETGGSKELQAHSHNIPMGIGGTLGSRNANDITARMRDATTTDTESFSTGSTGTGNSGNLQPYIVTNYIIKAKQAVGVVGTVSEDITDTNNNAVPTCETVKEYVDEKQTYSTTETKIGTWLGNDLYRKVLNIGNADFYSSTDKNFAHNITNLGQVIDIKYSMYFPGDSSWYIQWDKIITVKANSTHVKMTTGTLSAEYIRFTNMKIIIEYTKTTD